VFRADILFYFPGDGNWWLGTITGQLNWQLVGNTGKPHRERVRLHIKIIEPTTTQAFIDARVNAMKQIYSDNGILVEVGSTEDLSGDMTILPLRDLDVGTCSGAATAAQGMLFANRNNVGTNEVVAYFIRSTTPTALNGCATFPAGEPGAVVTSVASQWTLAHEIGHVLGLVHVPGEVCPPLGAAPTRLMTGCGTSLIVGTPNLVASEVTTMDSSALTIDC
jgi:Metallo-peptidase family M12B Reprolysin-like